MFKVDNVVITPLGVPGIICEVINQGNEFLVNEMPILSEAEIKAIEIGMITDESMEGVMKNYKFSELRSPTEDEKKISVIADLIESGCTFATAH
jgi:hypothetical protein